MTDRAQITRPAARDGVPAPTVEILVVIQVLPEVDSVDGGAFGLCGEVPLSMPTGSLPPWGSRIRFADHPELLDGEQIRPGDARRTCRRAAEVLPRRSLDKSTVPASHSLYRPDYPANGTAY